MQCWESNSYNSTIVSLISPLNRKSQLFCSNILLGLGLGSLVAKTNTDFPLSYLQTTTEAILLVISSNHGRSFLEDKIPCIPMASDTNLQWHLSGSLKVL